MYSIIVTMPTRKRRLPHIGTMRNISRRLNWLKWIVMNRIESAPILPMYATKRLSVSGKSGQSHQSYNGVLLKTHDISPDRRVIYLHEDTYSLDRYTLLIVNQLVMRSIYDTYNIGNIEHPLEMYRHSNSNKIHLEYGIYQQTFDEYIHKTTRLKCDNITRVEIYTKIVDVMIGLFLVDDLLYDICQFQHCDMKCNNVLVTEQSDGSIYATLIDFDTSTLTLNHDGQPYRIRRFLLDKLTTYLGGKGKGSNVSCSSTVSKMVSYNYTLDRNNTLKSSIQVYDDGNFVCEKDKNTKSWISLLKMLGFIHEYAPEKLKDSSIGGGIVDDAYRLMEKYGISWSKALGLGSSQTTERYQDRPLGSNDYYNNLLVASVALLCLDVTWLRVVYDARINDWIEMLHQIMRYNALGSIDHSVMYPKMFGKIKMSSLMKEPTPTLLVGINKLTSRLEEFKTYMERIDWEMIKRQSIHANM